MPRGLNAPPFPVTPGNWLTAYRYRGLGDGTRPSAEHLADLLGVSGATVRRWEADRVKPTREDVRRFAAVCDLAPLESDFLLRAMGSVNDETPPSQEAFGSLLNESTLTTLPAFVLDSLFYVRGWNSYLMTLSGRTWDELPSDNAIFGLFDPGRAVRRDTVIADPFTPWLRSFWLLTAELCGTPSYVQLLERLRGVADFEQRWWDLALSKKLASAPVNLPIVYNNPMYGAFRVITTTTTLPPNYYLRQYVPIDETSRTFMRKIREEPLRSGSSDSIHWSLAEAP